MLDMSNFNKKAKKHNGISYAAFSIAKTELKKYALLKDVSVCNDTSLEFPEVSQSFIDIF